MPPLDCLYSNKMTVLTDEQEVKLGRELDTMVQQGMDANKDWGNLWADGLSYVFNDQLAGKQRKQGWDRIQVNYIYPAVQQSMALLAQRRPQIMAQPFVGEHTRWASANEGILQYQFTKTLNMPAKLAAAALDGAVFGYYVAKHFWRGKSRWDEQNQRWIGDPKVIIINPYFFGAEPCESLDEAGWIFCRRRIPLAKALEQWPEHKDRIREAASLSDTERDPFAEQLPTVSSTQTQTDQGPSATMEGRLALLLQQARGESPGTTQNNDLDVKQASSVLVEEIYWRDNEERVITAVEPIPPEELMAQGVIQQTEQGYFDQATGEYLEDPNDWPTREEKRDIPIYPYGRFIFRIGTGEKTILNRDTADQVYPYHKWPFTQGVNSLLPHVWQGLNDVEMARGCQDWINISAMHMAEYVKNFANAAWMAEESAVPKNRKQLASRAGSIIKFPDGAITSGKVKRLDPASMSQGLHVFYQLMGEELKQQTGMEDIALGKQMSGDPTATEIRKLEQHSKVRTALKSILLDQWTVAVMGAVGELNQRHMEIGEMRRITGRKGQALIQVEEPMKQVLFDLRLEVGTALPQDREAMQQKLMMLAQLVGAPPILPELLEALEIPNADEIIQRVEAWQQIQQMMAEQEKAQQGQEKEPTPEEVQVDEILEAAGVGR